MFEFPEKGVIISTEKIKSTSWTADRFQQSTVPHHKSIHTTPTVCEMPFTG